MQQQTTGRDYTKSSQLFTNKYYSTIASKLKLTLFEILIKLETLANSIQLFYTYFKTSFNLLSTFFPSKTRAQRHVASRVFECSFYLTTFHLHDLLLNISRRVSAFLLERRREKDLESMIYHQFQNFFILFQHAWSRFPSFNQGSGVKTAEFPRDATQRCELFVAHFEWPRFLFLHFLAGFSARNRATILPTIAEPPSEALSGALLCLPFTLQSHFFSQRLMLRKRFSMKDKIGERGLFLVRWKIRWI